MKSFISEDDIEQALLKKLQADPFNYDIIICDASLDAQDNPDNGPHRETVEQCVLPNILKESLTRINPNISAENINDTVKKLSDNFAGKDMVETLIVAGIDINAKNEALKQSLDNGYTEIVELLKAAGAKE